MVRVLCQDLRCTNDVLGLKKAEQVQRQSATPRLGNIHHLLSQKKAQSAEVHSQSDGYRVLGCERCDPLRHFATRSVYQCCPILQHSWPPQKCNSSQKSWTLEKRCCASARQCDPAFSKPYTAMAASLRFRNSSSSCPQSRPGALGLSLIWTLEAPLEAHGFRDRRWPRRWIEELVCTSWRWFLSSGCLFVAVMLEKMHRSPWGLR